MHAVVVYESHWGNTAQVARAIAEGLGPDARVLTTDEASPEALIGVDLVVAGAPIMAFGLPSDTMVRNAGIDPKAPRPADVSHPTMRAWLDELAPVDGWDVARRAAAFETKLRWSPGGATGAIEQRLRRAGFQTVADGQKFYVATSYGPLRDGELDRARAWGEELARLVA